MPFIHQGNNRLWLILTVLFVMAVHNSYRMEQIFHRQHDEKYLKEKKKKNMGRLQQPIVQHSETLTSASVGTPDERAVEGPPLTDGVHPKEEKLELVHIPKTGGSAIEYAGSLANVTWGLCHWKARPLAGPGCQKPDWLHYNASQNLRDHDVEDSWEIWHTPPTWLKANSPYRNKTLFTVVRNPYERFISEYYCPYNGLNPVDWTLNDRGFVDPMGKPLIDALEQAKKKREAKTSTKKPETPQTLNEFLMGRLRYPSKWTAHYLPQSDYVFDEQGSQIVEHVLRHERLSQQFTELMRTYDLPVYLNTTVNQRNGESPAAPTRMTVDDLFPETIQRINQVARPDFSNFGYEMMDPEVAASERAKKMTVQRIYYINLLKNRERRQQMESWLSQQSIPYQRINATIGSERGEDCVAGKQSPKRCRGISGLCMTELDIIRNHNTSGLTLVFEDDFVVKQPLDKVVEQTLRLVPSDWDINRWDCWGRRPSSFDLLVRGERNRVFRTVHRRPCRASQDSPCWFAGGTHAMLWREESVSKLDEIWPQKPYNGVDVRLTTDKLNSYCVNIGIGALEAPDGERSDIPKGG